MNELTSRDIKILLCVWVFSACVYAQKCLEQTGHIDLGDVVFYIVASCVVVWGLLKSSPSRKQPYEVVVVNEPENSRPLIEERKV